MAKSRFEYVKMYEQDDRILRDCWIVVRLDGKGFTKFTQQHDFEKPNDKRGLTLMNASALEVLQAFPEIRIAYGQSDEFSFIFAKTCSLYGRRASKLVSLVVSCFSAAFVFNWPRFMDGMQLKKIPIFDGRAIAIPNDAALQDYFAWRQADTHVNNLYNTCFWAFVHGGLTPESAHEVLKGTSAGVKNEMLFSRFGINYNEIDQQFRKARSPVLRIK